VFWASCVFVIDKDKKVLILRRSDSIGTHRGKWALPGGKAELTELPEDTAIREIREETELILNESTLNFLHKSIRGPKDIYFFWSNDWSGKVSLDHEHEEDDWVPLEELDSRLQIPIDKGLISKLIKALKA
jgi:8-oxo-dGTP pyrophosphatase MutT (NUDIX family)